MKRLLAFICVLAMMASSMVSAFAADEYELIELPADVSVFGAHCFHNGYAPVLTDNGWKYVDTNGKIMPWNNFTTAFPFSEGLAAVEKDGKIGYIDTTGKLVIGFNSDAMFNMGMTMAGRFIGGKAVAIKKVGDGFDTTWDQVECYYIDKTGKNLGPVDVETAREIIGYDHAGVFGDNYITVTVNGITFEEVGMDEDAALVTDYDTYKCYILRKKASGGSSAGTSSTPAVKLPGTNSPSNWAKAEVEKAVEYKLLGNWVKTYQQKINRQEFATLIVTCVLNTKGLTIEEYLGEDINNPSHFTDTNDIYVKTASIMNIVNGVGDGKFAPEKNITRQEIAVMIYRAISYAQKMMGETYITDSTDLGGFTDAGSVASWAKTGVGTLAKNGIMKGTGETTLSPLDNTTTEQAILLAVRVFELMNK